MAFNFPSKPVRSALLFCSLILTFCCQPAWGQVEAWVGKSGYTSTSKILIEPGQPANTNASPGLPHDKIIASNMIVSKCFHDVPNLLQLKMFDDLSPPSVIENVVSNLEVTRDAASSVITLKFRAQNPRDAQTILTFLIDTYRKHLVSGSITESSKQISQIKDEKERLQEDSRRVEEEGQEMSGLAAVGAEFLTRRLVSNQTLLARKNRLKKLVADCIASQPSKQACRDMIWNLVEWDELRESNLQDPNPLDVLSRVTKKIETETAWLGDEIGSDTQALITAQLAELEVRRMEIESQNAPFKFTILKPASRGEK